MDRSDSLVELTKALNKFQAAMKSVKKESVNPFFHAKYADLDAVWEGARKPLTDNGLAVVQGPMLIDEKLFLETLLLHVSGEYIASYYPLTPMRQTQGQGWAPSDDPQSLGSAITYARRYALSAILGISADEDDDAEGAMKRARAKAEPEAKPKAKSDKPLLDQAREIVAAGPAPECACGKRIYRSGTNAKGPWRGWMCPKNIHAPEWIPTAKAMQETPPDMVVGPDEPPWDDSDDPRGDPTELTEEDRRLL